MSNHAFPAQFASGEFRIELKSIDNGAVYIESTRELAAARYAGIHRDMIKGESITLRRNGRVVVSDSK